MTGNPVTVPERNHTPDSSAARYIVCFAQQRPLSRFVLRRTRTEGWAMSLVRLLGFRTHNCGCVFGRYRELATSREVSYVEEKRGACEAHAHRGNHTIHEPAPAPTLVTRAS